MIDGIVTCRDQRATIDSDDGGLDPTAITCYCIPSTLYRTTIDSNLTVIICTDTKLTIVGSFLRDNGVDMAALHHKLAITTYIYQWLIIDTILIRSLCIDLTRAVLLGVLKSKFAPNQNVFIIGICTLDRMTVHIKDYILPCLYYEVTARSHIYIIEHLHGLSCCCCICSLLQRGILCFAYLGVVSGDNIDTILLLSHRVFIQESRHIRRELSSPYVKYVVDIIIAIIDHLYGSLGAHDFLFSRTRYSNLGIGHIVVTTIAVIDDTAGSYFYGRIAHLAYEAGVASSDDIPAL